MAVVRKFYVVVKRPAPKTREEVVALIERSAQDAHAIASRPKFEEVAVKSPLGGHELVARPVAP